MNDKPTYSAKLVAQMSHDFLATPFGTEFVRRLSEMRDIKLSEAKATSDPSIRCKALDEAVGMDSAIDFLLQRDKQLQADYYKDEPAKQ